MVYRVASRYFLLAGGDSEIRVGSPHGFAESSRKIDGLVALSFAALAAVERGALPPVPDVSPVSVVKLSGDYRWRT